MLTTFTTMNCNQVGPDFALWFRRIYKANSRPKKDSIIKKFYEENLNGFAVHQFMLHIEFNHNYFVHYRDMKEAGKIVPNVTYHYKNGKFTTYTIRDRTGKVVKNAAPHGPTNSDTLPSVDLQVKENFEGAKKLVAKTDYIAGLVKGMVIVYDKLHDNFYSAVNPFTTVPVAIAMIPELFEEYSGMIYNKFVRSNSLKDVVFLKTYHGYMFGYNNDTQSVYFFRPVIKNINNREDVIGRLMPCEEYHEKGFYIIEADEKQTVCFFTGDRLVLFSEELELPIQITRHFGKPKYKITF